MDQRRLLSITYLLFALGIAVLVVFLIPQSAWPDDWWLGRALGVVRGAETDKIDHVGSWLGGWFGSIAFFWFAYTVYLQIDQLKRQNEQAEKQDQQVAKQFEFLQAQGSHLQEQGVALREQLREMEQTRTLYARQLEVMEQSREVHARQLDEMREASKAHLQAAKAMEFQAGIVLIERLEEVFSKLIEDFGGFATTHVVRMRDIQRRIDAFVQVLEDRQQDEGFGWNRAWRTGFPAECFDEIFAVGDCDFTDFSEEMRLVALNVYNLTELLKAFSVGGRRRDFDGDLIQAAGGLSDDYPMLIIEEAKGSGILHSGRLLPIDLAKCVAGNDFKAIPNIQAESAYSSDGPLTVEKAAELAARVGYNLQSALDDLDGLSFHELALTFHYWLTDLMDDKGDDLRMLRRLQAIFREVDVLYRGAEHFREMASYRLLRSSPAWRRKVEPLHFVLENSPFRHEP